MKLSVILAGLVSGISARPFQRIDSFLRPSTISGFSSSAPAFISSAKNSMSASSSSSSLLHGASETKKKFPIVGEEMIMSPKAHGTSEKPVQEKLKWNCDTKTADRICNFNRHYAEYAGYWSTTEFLKTVSRTEPTKYYDSVTGKHLFTAPVGRTIDEFLKESSSHGWPSFRDEEVNWDNVRCLKDGECVSITGTHLGHNLPDKKGNRYCINLVCVAGNPTSEE